MDWLLQTSIFFSFVFDCAWSSLLHEGFLQVQQVGVTL